VFDTGSTSARNINKMGFNAGNIQGIFLTHFHSDHIDGLGELLLQRWVSNSNAQPVDVHGPEGVATVVNGLMQAYSLDRGYRVAHHGEAVLPQSGFGAVPKTFGLQDEKATLVFESPDTQIYAFSVSHAPIHPAVGYKIKYKDIEHVYQQKNNIKEIEKVLVRVVILNQNEQIQITKMKDNHYPKEEKTKMMMTKK
jgi:ribonuclease Z